uniref:Uncharacterized protein n=1 Tax=Romanomermis culicivorax TaxID=13658 RepID=A0A915HLE2_ROMCU
MLFNSCLKTITETLLYITPPSIINRFVLNIFCLQIASIDSTTNSKARWIVP